MNPPKCCECGRLDNLQQHHIIPKADGGAEDGTTVWLCAECHHRLHTDNGDFARWTEAWFFQFFDQQGKQEGKRILRQWGKKGHETYREQFGADYEAEQARRGLLGGEKTLALHGREHYVEMGRKSAAARRKKG